MLQDLIENAAQARRLPEIAGARCVHGFIENARCRSCVEVCPKEAWVLDDELLGIDPEACDGCGLCAAVCTEGAILHDHEPLLSQWKETTLALCACEKNHPDISQAGVIPCVHALGINNLLMLYRQGCQSLFISRGDCDHCSRGDTPRLDTRVARLNVILTQRGLPRLNFKTIPAAQWQRMTRTVGDPRQPEQPVSRRHFLRQAVVEAAEQGLRVAGLREAEEKAFDPPATLLPDQGKSGGLLPWTPEIDMEKCNGCDACARLCPHGAVQLEEAENELYYTVAAWQCTGCLVCVDACDQHAITVTTQTSATQTRVTLRQARCRACGAPFHEPESSPHRHGLCRICSQVNHARNLFQVLE